MSGVTVMAVVVASCSTSSGSGWSGSSNTADGISLDGAMVGTGTVGVVLAHEYDDDLCGAWPFANYPAKRGLRVFAVDARCFGRSICPQGDAAGRVVDDHVAAVAQLRQRGVTRVTLGGASIWRLGGADRRQASKASGRRGSQLSGQANPTSLLRIPLNRGAVQQLTVQTMSVVAK
jgi:hypothetical protein